MRSRRRQALLALWLLCLLPLAFQALAFTPGRLVIVGQDGVRHAFEIELAATPADREHGLMFRERMAADHGMLFDFDTLQPVAMWMKNTRLPLDMLFIADDGRITSIAADAVPFSETIIPSTEPVRAVLELNAGTARRLGLVAGDRVEHPIFAHPG